MPRIQINLTGTTGRANSTWTVTTQWAISALPTAAQMATQLAAARSALVASAPFRAGIGSTYALVSLRALGYPVPTGNALWTVDAGGTGVAGTATPLPIPLAVVVSEQTGAAGPSYRGRSYWPGTPGGFGFNDGTIAAAAQQLVRTSWLAAHSIIGTALTPLGGSPVHVVYSPKTGQMTPITLIRTGNRVDTARGRFGDSPEVYISEALPTQVQLAEEPSDDQVGVDALGPIPAALSPAEAAALIKQYSEGGGTVPQKLGPLDQLIYDAGFRLIPPDFDED